jgi:hypothetical protein
MTENRHQAFKYHNKIMNWQQTIILSLIVFFIQPVKTMAVGSQESDSSLPVIRTVVEYKRSIKNTTGKQLINLQTFIPGIVNRPPVCR